MILNVIIIVVPCFLFIDINPSNYLQWAVYAIVIVIYAFIIILANAMIFDREQLKLSTKRIISMIGGKRK